MAKSAFERAIQRDPADPLPRLGMGLAKNRASLGFRFEDEGFKTSDRSATGSSDVATLNFSREIHDDLAVSIHYAGEPR